MRSLQHFAILLLIFGGTVNGAEMTPTREWSDSTGEHKITASLQSVEIVLLDESGKLRRVSIDKLSDKDRRAVAQAIVRTIRERTRELAKNKDAEPTNKSSLQDLLARADELSPEELEEAYKRIEEVAGGDSIRLVNGRWKGEHKFDGLTVVQVSTTLGPDKQRMLSFEIRNDRGTKVTSEKIYVDLVDEDGEIIPSMDFEWMGILNWPSGTKKSAKLFVKDSRPIHKIRLFTRQND